MNETMIQAEVTSEEGLRRTIKVEAPATNVSDAFDTEYRKIQKSVTLKGFRKGKAPLSRIKQLYAGDVTSGVLDNLLSRTYPEAVQKLQLNVAAPPRVSDVTLKEGEPFSFVAEVEVFPTIDKVDISGLVYTEANAGATEVEVDEIIESLRRDRSPVEDVDRSIGAADIVTADMKKTKDEGNVIEGDTFPDSVIDLSNENTVKEFREALPGSSVGDTVSVTVSYPEDYSDKLFAGKSISYDLAVKKVQERKLLPLDDAFAKEHGGADSLDALRVRVREGIQKDRERHNERERNNQLISQVVAKNPIEAPAALVSRYVDDVVADYRKNYPDQEMNEEELRQRYRVVGANQLRWKLLSDKLIEQEAIEVSEEDTDNWIKDFATGSNLDPAAARNALASGGRMDKVRESILENKLLNLLKERATAKKA